MDCEKCGVALTEENTCCNGKDCKECCGDCKCEEGCDCKDEKCDCDCDCGCK